MVFQLLLQHTIIHSDKLTVGKYENRHLLIYLAIYNHELNIKQF